MQHTAEFHPFLNERNLTEKIHGQRFALHQGMKIRASSAFSRNQLSFLNENAADRGVTAVFSPAI
ncbi:hypothetical protein ACPVTF_01685 [Geobacillus icigianus]|uniref:hypothetical protein n=1 Tax=Geobacillus TaxID=129337 RepID=UPI000784AD45|nr:MULTISPECIES: hypothetical protein [Geobacillus]